MAATTEAGSGSPSSHSGRGRHVQVRRALVVAVTGWIIAALVNVLLGRRHAAFFAVVAALSWLPVWRPTDRLRPRLASLVLGCNLAAIFGVAFESGGASSGIVMVFAPLVLGVGLAASPRAGAVVTSITVAGIVALGLYEASGHDVGAPVVGEPAFGLAVSLVVTLLLGIQAHRVVDAERAAALAQAAEARALATKLEQARAAQELAALRKATFYATMSHEVRTPLGGLLGLMTALEGSSLDAAQLDLLEHMRTSGEALRMLVNDMLDLESFERGVLRIEERVLDARLILEDIVALYAATANAKGVTLSLSIPDVLPCALASDPLRVRQVLQNLVNNALKFTDSGEVSVEARYRAGHLELTVRDSGRGISEDRLGAIFQPFEQSDPTLARRYGGTGLGLAIVKHLVDAMGGTVRVESEPGRGTSFFVRLPMRLLDEAEALAPKGVRSGQRRLEPIEPRHRGMHALVVDDDRINRLATSLVLRRFGVISVEADSGAQALPMLAHGQFDVAFLDLHMPDMLGTELATHILALPIRPPYLVALSASVMPEDRTAALASGISEFLAKPLDVRSLTALLDRVPRRTVTPLEDATSAPRRAFSPRSALPTPLGFDRELDRARLHELRDLTGDRAEFDGLLRSFLQQLSGSIVELENLDCDGNAAAFRALVHRIRGSAMNIGAGALAAAAATAEDVVIRGADSDSLRAEAREVVAAAQRAQRAMAVLLAG